MKGDEHVEQFWPSCHGTIWSIFSVPKTELMIGNSLPVSELMTGAIIPGLESSF